MNNYTYRNTNKEPENPTNDLKDKLLGYLKNALINQEYEKCPGLIKNAKSAGVSTFEIELLLADVVRGIAGEEQVEVATNPRF